MIRLQTLGSLELRAADGAVLHPVLRQSKRLALLAYLAIERPGQFHRRDQLLGLFWPESDQKSARASLSQAIHFLRQHLGKDAIVNRGDEEIALNRDLVWCDAAAFQSHVAVGEYAEATELYVGDLLPGVFVDEAEGFEQWLEQKRDSLKRQAKDACVALADAASEKGAHDDVARWLRRAIQHFPYDEHLHRRLIIALDGAGDKAAALRAYDELAQTLRAEFDTEPSAETTEVIQHVRARTEAQAIPLPPRPTFGLMDGQATARGSVVPSADRRRGRQRLIAAVAIAVLILAGVLWGAWSSREPSSDELPVNRIAVLFFNDASPKRELGYLADGLTSALIDHLGQVRQIEVISQNGVRPFRGDSIPLDSIARMLDVGTIVTGSLTESNGQLRLTVEMVRGATSVVGRSKTFTRPIGELFALLDDVSAEVGSFLRSSVGKEIKLLRYQSETQSVEAWQAVQKAEELLEEARTAGERADTMSSRLLFSRADSLLRRAAELDRRWAGPLVVQAQVDEARAWLSTLGMAGQNPQQHLEAALSAADEAIRRNPNYAAAYEARGRVRYLQWLMSEKTPDNAETILAASETDLQQALSIDPNRARAESTLSLLYESLGRYEEARRAAERALEADAYLEDAEQIVARLFQSSFELGDDEAAGRWCDETRRRSPGKWPSAFCDLILLGWRQDVTPDARKALYILETFGTTDEPGIRNEMRPRLAMLAAVTVARAGDRTRAEAMVKEARAAAPRDPELDWLEAAYRVKLGEYEAAERLLRKYVRAYPGPRNRFENGRMFKPLRAWHATARSAN